MVGGGTIVSHLFSPLGHIWADEDIAQELKDAIVETIGEFRYCHIVLKSWQIFYSRCA